MLQRITYQGTNHHNTDRQSIPQTPESNISVDAAHRSTKGLTRLTVRIQLADHHVGRVRDHRTENTSQVTTSKRNSRLCTLVVVRFLAWQVLVDHLDNRLKRGKLHHRVGNLATPKWIQTLVQTGVETVNILLQRNHNLVWTTNFFFRWGTYPETPSLATTEEIPLKVPRRSGGMVVCMRTLTDSNGQRATSAMNSAEALATRYKDVFHSAARSCPTRSL